MNEDKKKSVQRIIEDINYDEITEKLVKDAQSTINDTLFINERGEI